MWLVKYILCVGMVTAFDQNEPLERDEVIQAVNNAQTTWKAGRNFDPTLTKKFVRNLLGLKKAPEGRRLPPYEDDGEEVTLPKNFDARAKWDKCTSLQQVRDQGPCGSCWAVSAAATFTDRLCIASKTAWNGHLSGEEVLSCCSECGDGCDGGYDDKAWSYFQERGLVTGGDYHSHQGCQPYLLPTCEHHVPGPKKNCSSYGDLPTPACQTKCYNKKYKTPFKKDHHKVKSTFTISRNNNKAQKELFKNGPIQAGFIVYEDFLSYKSGVYYHTWGDALGGHAVKVVGWGVENKIPYWLVANSWNSDWGDKGFFKIRRGHNDCYFEEDFSGGYPYVKSFSGIWKKIVYLFSREKKYDLSSKDCGIILPSYEKK